MTDGSLSDLIRLAYRVALDPDRFDDLLESWDRFCARALSEGGAPGDGAAAQEIDMVDLHFDQALELATDPRLDDAAVLDGFFAQQTAPTALVDAGLAVVAAGSLFAPGFRRALEDAPPPRRDPGPGDDGATGGATGGGPRSLALRNPETGEPLLAVLSPPPAAVARVAPEARHVIRFAATDWPEAASGILREACGLSQSEIDVARMLAAGVSPADIAERRSRSLETIRSQIKAIQEKTGARRQTGLIQFLTMLRHLAATPDEGADAAATGDDFSIASTQTADGRRLAYAAYGAADGSPTLYLTTSSRPEETAAFRAAAARAGLAVVAPYRPGFGASDPGPSWFARRETLADDVSAALSAAGVAPEAPLLVAGHREGGALAAIAADALMRRRRIDGVAMISTGAPAADFSAFDDAPISVRRSFLAARHAPFALRVGYRTAARLFRSGQAGEDKIVGYFFKESPPDRALMANPSLRATTRDNIAYSFEHCDAIVEDIGVWISDWAAGLSGPGAPPWIFVHGRAHGFQDAARVGAYAAAHPGAEAVIVPGAAQMLLYEHPDVVADAVARLARKGAVDR